MVESRYVTPGDGQGSIICFATKASGNHPGTGILRGVDIPGPETTGSTLYREGGITRYITHADIKLVEGLDGVSLSAAGRDTG